MEIISILRVLRRRWLLLLPGVALGVLGALIVLYHVSFLPPSLASRQTVSGTATGRELLAARDVPAFDLDSGISATLPNRAVMLSDLMATHDRRVSIARRAGVTPEELAILGPASGTPEIAVPIAVESTAAASLAYEPYVLTITTGAQVPIITLRASAATSAQAAKLVDAAREEMEATIKDGSDGTRSVGAERLGPVFERTSINGPKKPVGIAVGLMLFCFWAGCIVIFTGLSRQMREYRAGAGSQNPATT
jgi:hypothetical protein